MTELLAGRKYAPRSLGDVLVLGLGVTGRACVDYLRPLEGGRVHSLTIAEDDSQPVQGNYDLCIASPGISQFSDFYQQAQRASAEVVSEVEFAWRESLTDDRWVAITGTNGKTTTTALAAHILDACGYDVSCVGNIGDACITAVGRAGEVPNSQRVYVAELSSYQLASTRLFAPNVAVVLNITPDHLAWHRTHENYAQAKWRIMANLHEVPGAVAVLNATDDEVRATIRAIKADPARGYEYIPLGTSSGIAGDMRLACGAKNAAFVSGEGVLTVVFQDTQHALCATAELLLSGAHNVENALAAAAAAVALGAPAPEVARALRTFAPLEHRIEPCGEVAGVRFYNDSKATNTDATLKAVSAFLPERPILLLGGRDKGTDLTDLVAACEAHAKAVVLFGEARERFSDAFANARQVDVRYAEHLADAFESAVDAACPGDLVVLSPACASFDEFSCFEERGRRFKDLVAAHAARAGR